MSPTIFFSGPYRFYLFSREETRKHVHVMSADGEAKFWIEPVIALADYKGLKKKQLKRLQALVEEHRDEIEAAWKEHFGG